MPANFDNVSELRKRVTELNLRPTVSLEQLLASANRIKPADLPAEKLPEDVKASIPALKPETPLWYYVLREAAVLAEGNRLGPVGGRIVAETFVRILKRDASSYLNVANGFTPTLPWSTPGDFTVADLVTFAGVTQAEIALRT